MSPQPAKPVFLLFCSSLFLPTGARPLSTSAAAAAFARPAGAFKATRPASFLHSLDPEIHPRRLSAVSACATSGGNFPASCLDTTRALQVASRSFSSAHPSKLNKMAAYMGGFDPKDPQQVADVVLVPTLSDNYAYLLIDRATKAAACIDPAEPEKVLKAAQAAGAELKMCLCTHKHLDHSGGNVQLSQKRPDLEMVGSGYEETPGVKKTVRDGDMLSLGDLHIRVLHTPCHTGGHVLYFVTSPKQPSLAPIIFTGDTLFVGGCGRFFEGTAQQMVHALLEVIKPLPANTRVFCGHEYTKSNLEFALKVEPGNADLKAKYDWTVKQREAQQPTIPSTIEQELRFNPFMRVEEKSVQEAMKSVGDTVETMQRLRELKNRS